MPGVNTGTKVPNFVRSTFLSIPISAPHNAMLEMHYLTASIIQAQFACGRRLFPVECCFFFTLVQDLISFVHLVSLAIRISKYLKQIGL
jgi:hypothetical protein